MRKEKTCIECQKGFTPRDSQGSEAWVKRMFCGQPCSYKFRRRERRHTPHPPEVMAALAANDITPYREVVFGNFGSSIGAIRPGG